MKAGVVEIQCLIMLVKFTKCILIKLVFTEGCVEKFDYSKLQRWANGERYGKSMIHDFNNGTGLDRLEYSFDQNGGPNHVGNFCFSPIHGDTRTGLIYTPSYYYIGHFSKFIGKSAKELAVSRVEASY
jgi:glucosylceramidase